MSSVTKYFSMVEFKNRFRNGNPVMTINNVPLFSSDTSFDFTPVFFLSSIWDLCYIEALFAQA